MRTKKKGNSSQSKGSQNRQNPNNGFISDLFKPKLTYRAGSSKTALKAAYEAGVKWGDTGEFDPWWKKYRNKAGVAKKSVQKAFDAGVMGTPIKNGLFSKSTEEITEGFHGRPVREEVEILEEENYSAKLSGLGLLCELEVLINEATVVPIKFSYSKVSEAVMLTCDEDGNIEFVGGDQDLGKADELKERFQLEEIKAKLLLGEVDTISYFADKCHLEGPKSQAKGTEYIHKFGEEGGERPTLVYDSRNKKLVLVGGDYTITDEGIRN